jgi:hypothetical protein
MRGIAIDAACAAPDAGVTIPELQRDAIFRFAAIA